MKIVSRLLVQCLKPNQWSRVPNVELKIHALKLSDIRGWSLLCEDALSMIALHIPEEDRYWLQHYYCGVVVNNPGFFWNTFAD